MRIIGIDPSLAHTGLICLEGDIGAWALTRMHLVSTETEAAPRKNEDDLRRSMVWLAEVRPFIENADMLCVELPQIGGANMQARSMWTSGIALGLVASLSPAVVALHPRQIKEVTGIKDADKAQMCNWAYQMYPAAAWPSRKVGGQQVPLVRNHHLADALATAVTGLILKNMWKPT